MTMVVSQVGRLGLSRKKTGLPVVLYWGNSSRHSVRGEDCEGVNPAGLADSTIGGPFRWHCQMENMGSRLREPTNDNYFWITKCCPLVGKGFRVNCRKLAQVWVLNSLRMDTSPLGDDRGL